MSSNSCDQDGRSSHSLPSSCPHPAWPSSRTAAPRLWLIQLRAAGAADTLSPPRVFTPSVFRHPVHSLYISPAGIALCAKIRIRIASYQSLSLALDPGVYFSFFMPHIRARTWTLSKNWRSFEDPSVHVFMGPERVGSRYKYEMKRLL